jgi:hypothetical protein
MIQRKEMFYSKQDSDRVITKIGVLLTATLFSSLVTAVFDYTFLEALGLLGVGSVLYVVARSKVALDTLMAYSALMFTVYIVSVFSGWTVTFFGISGVVMVFSLFIFFLKKELPEFPDDNE